MPLLLIEPPSAEPVSLADAKAWLRVEHADEDALIGGLVKAARLLVEAATGRRLVRQRVRLVLDRWPEGGVLALPVAPLLGLVAARVHPASGAAAELDLDRVTVDRAGAAPRLYFPERPAPGRKLGGIEIEVTAGYGDPADVPERFVQAIRLLVAHWHAHREAVAEPGAAAATPLGVAALLAPERVMRR